MFRVSVLVSPFLCSLLGGYDAIAAVADNLLLHLQADPQLARFWPHRGEDDLKREKQLLVGFSVRVLAVLCITPDEI
jgi:hypothetical protein